MNADNTNQATAYGEYPVSSSTNVASSSAEAIPTSTEGFAQYDTTTNEIGLDTQVNTNTDFQALTNFGGDDNDFASVNILSSDESSNVQVGGFEATTTTNTNVDFTTSTQVDTNMNFDTNAQIDFGTTNTTSEMDVLQATSGNTETQYGEYQATSPIIDTAESAQIVENTSIEGNMNFNADTFQSVEPNVEMENNNFDFTTNNSIVGATSALNNFETTSTNFDINNIDFTASTPAVDTNTNFEINTTTAETTYGQTDLTHELVDPNPIETMTEDTEVNLGYDKELLYKNMVEAKAEWLYTLPQWDALIPEDRRKELYKEQKSSHTVVKAAKVGRNDPCPCGSGKKYKFCCGK